MFDHPVLASEDEEEEQPSVEVVQEDEETVQ